LHPSQMDRQAPNLRHPRCDGATAGVCGVNVCCSSSSSIHTQVLLSRGCPFFTDLVMPLDRMHVGAAGSVSAAGPGASAADCGC
jgi:hypothetical protein